jgi:hypothetical protein
MWVVVLNVKSNSMGIVTREEREKFIELCMKMKVAIPTIVVAKFEDFREAVKYAKDIYEVNQLIDGL